MIVIRVIAVLVGLIGLFLYFRSIVRVMLLNRRERDGIERFARIAAVSIARKLGDGGHDIERVQRSQAWTLPLFIFIAVVAWFLLVQFSFSFILWGLALEATWPRAFSSSGSALSTLGYLTPPTLFGEYLAVYEAAIGLAIVILLFTFVPGYQAAIQARERKVGWLHARTGRNPTCATLLEALKRSGRIDDPEVWENWESWFRDLVETQSLAPILAYVPSVYPGTTWVRTASAVLDSTSFVLSSLDTKAADAARLCRETGMMAVDLIAEEIDRGVSDSGASGSDAKLIAAFNELYDHLAGIGLPIRPNRDACRDAFITLHAEYSPKLARISRSTMMPIAEPWVPAGTMPRTTVPRAVEGDDLQ